jgi:hypothetical protein
VTHSLVHQILVSDLVLPIALAQTPDQQTLPRFGARLADDTYLRGDVIVANRARVPSAGWYVDGPPLLVVEVASDASIRRDLGQKKAMWARFGVPSLWIVEPLRRLPRIRVFELDGGKYDERARLSQDKPYLVTRPFEMKLAPAEIFEQLSRRPAGKDTARRDTATKNTGAMRRTTMTEPDRAGTDLPAPEEKILIDAFGRRWPTGAEKVELWDGCPVFYGVWDERDVEIARRAYPGRVVRLDQEPGRPGTLCVLPADRPAERAGETRPINGSRIVGPAR